MTGDIEHTRKVSIIIPAYNVSKYIKRCVESAMNQTLKDIEIIIVNDGSSDNTLEILKDFKNQDERIILISQENKGLSEARNAGIDIARGEYIQHLDGDDWIENNACKETYNYAKKCDLDVVVFDYYEDDDKGKLKYIKDLDIKNYDTISGEEYVKLFFHENLPNVVWSKIWRRKLYNKIRHPKGYINFGEDTATTPRLAFKAKKIGKINKAFMHYIYNQNSITNHKKALKFYQLEDVFNILVDYFVNQQDIILAINDFKLKSLLLILFYKSEWGNEKYIKGVNLTLKTLKNLNWKTFRCPWHKKIALRIIVLLIHFFGIKFTNKFVYLIYSIYKVLNALSDNLLSAFIHMFK